MKHFLFASLLAAFSVLAVPSYASAVEPPGGVGIIPVQDQSWAEGEERIVRYDVDLTVLSDGALSVVETIVYDFADLPDKHGIYRDIPVFLSGEGGSRKLRISMQSIEDENGDPYPAETSYENGFRRSKIGDPAVTVSGEKTYVLSYVVRRAVVPAEELAGEFADGRDFLLWNAIGTGWTVPIVGGETRVSIDGSAGAPTVFCLVGSEGSTDDAGCGVSLGQDGLSRVVTMRSLAPQEGLTVQVRWPSGITQYPTGMRRFFDRYGESWGVLVLLGVLAALIWLYTRFGRDAGGRSVYTTEFDLPAGLNAAEAGALADEKVHDRDLTALIVDLAARGYLHITEEKKPLWGKDYRFTQTREADDVLDPIETRLLDRVFRDGNEVRVSELKQKMAETWNGIRSSIYSGLTERGYFRANPVVIRGIAYGVGIFFAVAALVMTILHVAGLAFANLLTGGSLLVSSVLVLLSARALPARTEKGVAAYEHIRGLKRYLTVAEKERLSFEEAEARYSKLLPAALALGVAAAWSERFSGLLRASPSWYTGTDGTFDSVLFARSLTSFSRTTSASLSAPKPSSSGGGSGGGVGGGGGGGGGGSW